MASTNEFGRTGNTVSDKRSEAFINNSIVKTSKYLSFRGEVDVKLIEGINNIFAIPNCRERGKFSVLFDPAILEEIEYDNRIVEILVSHEISHFKQYEASNSFYSDVCLGKRFPVIDMELLADYGAGFAVQSIYQSMTKRPFVLAVSKLADYDFSNIRHHGPVSQRLNAFNVGQWAAFQGYTFDMLVLLKNIRVFRDLMDGPPIATTSNSSELRKYYDTSIQRIHER